jgi:hypothetical protein
VEYGEEKTEPAATKEYVYTATAVIANDDGGGRSVDAYENERCFSSKPEWLNVDGSIATVAGPIVNVSLVSYASSNLDPPYVNSDNLTVTLVDAIPKPFHLVSLYTVWQFSPENPGTLHKLAIDNYGIMFSNDAFDVSADRYLEAMSCYIGDLSTVVRPGESG